MSRQWIVQCGILSFSLWMGVVAAESGHKTEKNATKRALALLNATKGNRVQGVVSFTAQNSGVRIVADVNGLEPGKHAFSIHEYGDCSAADGSSIGGHFNPTHSKHGGPDHLTRHVGDLGNIVADEKGHAHYERVDSLVTLDGPNSVIGKSIAVHAGADDFKTQPNGNSGGCVSCGIIE